MKNGIPDKMYYFLLDYKDKNITEFFEMYGKDARLTDLYVPQLLRYNRYAIKQLTLK